MGAQFVSKMWWLWRYSWSERSKYKFTPRMYAANEINSIIFNPLFWNILSAVNSLKPNSKYILFVKFIYSIHLFTRIMIWACIPYRAHKWFREIHPANHYAVVALPSPIIFFQSNFTAAHAWDGDFNLTVRLFISTTSHQYTFTQKVTKPKNATTTKNVRR